MVESANAESSVVATTQLQIVMVPGNSELFEYRSNIGGVITPDLSLTNPAGSTYVLKGGLFPGGTVDPFQASYTVDKNGVPLTGANSIGTGVCTGTRLITWNVLGPFPPEGTLAEEMNWSFLFKNADPADENAVYSKGWLKVGTLSYGGDFVVGRGQLGLLGGTGPNVRVNGEIKAKEFLSPDGRAILVNIESSVSILLNVPR